MIHTTILSSRRIITNLLSTSSPASYTGLPHIIVGNYIYSYYTHLNNSAKFNHLSKAILSIFIHIKMNAGFVKSILKEAPTIPSHSFNKLHCHDSTWTKAPYLLIYIVFFVRFWQSNNHRCMKLSGIYLTSEALPGAILHSRMETHARAEVLHPGSEDASSLPYLCCLSLFAKAQRLFHLVPKMPQEWYFRGVAGTCVVKPLYSPPLRSYSNCVL